MQDPDIKDKTPRPLSDYVEFSLDHYFESLQDSTPPTDLYRLILEQVEKPLFARVLQYNQHNQSRAAAMLGLNRGTLRKKLRYYGLI